ncbi:MAG: T9SS type A sorting domain-containing protein [Balneolaceae bacterium]
MKRVALLIVLSIITTSIIYGQTEVQKTIDKQYINKAHKAFLYQVSPQIKAADKWALEISRLQEQSPYLSKLADEINSDTTLSYEEYKSYEDSVFRPQKVLRYASSGSSSKSQGFYNEHVWIADSMHWAPKSLQNRYYDETYGDSSITYYYNFGEYEPYYGVRYKNPLEAAEGADSETTWDYYSPESGWQKNSRDLRYQNELGQDTLTVRYEYNMDIESYQISAKNRYKAEENYYFYSTEYFSKGKIYNKRIQEITPEFERSENIYYANGAIGKEDGEVISGDKSFTKIEEGNRYIYQVSKVYDSQLMKWVGDDSLRFNYLDNDTKTEAIGYEWNDSVWVFSQAYTSFQRTLSNDEIVVDSVVVYHVDYNETTMMNEIMGVELKTEMDYDQFANQIEVRTFSIVGDSLVLTSRTVREFQALENYLGVVYYTQSKQVQYSRDYFTGEFYMTNVYETKYSADGVYLGNSSFNFSTAGDTTYGYINQVELLKDGSTVRARFDWDYTLKKLILRSYQITGRKTTGSGEDDLTRNFNQTLYSSIYNGQEAITRNLNAYASYPGIFNDGPIIAEIGDTLMFYVSGLNPDLSIPIIEVSNMPATATFDSETRRFFWIVDEENPSPMTYKATRGDKYVTAEVEFINEQFAVSSEAEENPNEFKLSQNYPNPFNPSTNISFSLPSSGEVGLKVYNLLGQEVATLINNRMNAGAHTVQFDASRLASGVYIYRLVSGGFSKTKKMMLIK